MVGNVNLLRYLASSLQPSSQGPCLNTSTSTSFQKRHNFFRMMRNERKNLAWITWLEERIGVIYGVVAHETCRWRDFVFLMSGIPGFSENFDGKTVFRTPTNPPLFSPFKRTVYYKIFLRGRTRIRPGKFFYDQNCDAIGKTVRENER